MNKIDIKEEAVCSLGTLCHTAEILKRCNIKKCSYPFDWVFSDWSIISNCLENNFEQFLDKTLYTEPVFKFTDRQCGHKTYHQDFFFHKNPKDREEDYNYYKRCIERFNTLLQSNEKKLFVTLAVPHGTREPAIISELIEKNVSQQEICNFFVKEMEKFTQTLRLYTSNFILLSIINFPDQLEQNINFQEINENLHIMQLYTKSKSNGKLFLDETDNVYLDETLKNIYNFS